MRWASDVNLLSLLASQQPTWSAFGLKMKYYEISTITILYLLVAIINSQGTRQCESYRGEGEGGTVFQIRTTHGLSDGLLGNRCKTVELIPASGAQSARGPGRSHNSVILWSAIGAALHYRINTSTAPAVCRATACVPIELYLITNQPPCTSPCPPIFRSCC